MGSILSSHILFFLLCLLTIQAMAEKVDEKMDETCSTLFRTLFIVSLVAAIAFLLCFLVALYHLIRLRRREQLFLAKAEVEAFLNGGTELLPQEVGNYSNAYGIKLQPFNKDLEIPKAEFILEESSILAVGSYSKVYKAEVKGMSVAVKAPLPDRELDKDNFRRMLMEVKLLAYLGEHHNLIKFVGCYTKEIENGVLYAVLDLCENGSLQGHLRNTREDNAKWDELLRFSYEIANGMEFIGSRNVFHGDVATRNILLDKNLVCKIGDFGLSRRLDYETYVKTAQEPLPWRWMAYESLMKMEFSIKSDVWSYGITLWEIFSLGGIPYPGLSWTTHFVDDLKEGLRPTSPQHATEDIYQKMSACWDFEREARPGFKELHEFFRGKWDKIYYSEL